MQIMLLSLFRFAEKMSKRLFLTQKEMEQML